MTPREFIDDLRIRVNPAYADIIGTESYERRMCADMIEELLHRYDLLIVAVQNALDKNGHLEDGLVIPGVRDA